MSEEKKISFLLPCYVGSSGWSCAREFCEKNEDLDCGCPTCLASLGLTLTWDIEDYNTESDLQDHWRKRIVALRIGRFAPHLILPGYPGHEPAIAGTPTGPTPPTEDTLPGESQSTQA